MSFFSARALFLTTIILYLTACSSTQEQQAYPKLPEVDASAIYSKSRDLQNFDDYVLFLKGKAFSQGVSAKTLFEQQNIQYVQSAVDADHKQAGKKKITLAPATTSAVSFATGSNPSAKMQHEISAKPSKTAQKHLNAKKTRKVVNSPATRYLNRVISARKVELARHLLQQHQPLLQQASQQFNVPEEYIVALWGMESSFGRYQGKYDVLSVLATLAFEGRRENLFSREFISALKMLDQQSIVREKMLGSWAGAMGQTQFMPTSYLRYAIDANQDKQKDIWKTQDDVFSSIANYLSTVGWDAKQPWGEEIIASKSVLQKYSGIEPHKKKTLVQWKKLGVKFKFAKSISPAKQAALMNTELWLVNPEGHSGRAFLVSNNYRTLLNWNNSNHFALSIGIFAERIKEFAF